MGVESDSVPAPLLEGIRVLDFGRYIAGPYCAALLADFGADVIRIERIDGGEDRYVSPVTDSGEGSLYLQLNRNKRAITLNPMKPEGQEVVARLVASADVVVANMPPEALNAMQLDYPSLRRHKDDIILAHQTAFGATGPYAKRTGFDGVAQAMSGATYLSGLPNQPLKSYASWCDYSTGMLAAYGTLAALFHRYKTGRGQVVGANLFATALNIFHFNNLEQHLTGRRREASGNRSQFGGPADLFRTRDGWVQVHVIGQGVFKRWCELLGELDWLDDPRFKTDHERGLNGSVLSDRTQLWIKDKTNAQALAELETAKIPAGPLLKPHEVMHDEHIQATQMLTEVEYPGLKKKVPLMGNPLEFSELDVGIRRRPATLGEHTHAILTELDYSESDIDALRANRVV